jgi:O-antigen/teichoic acid export membrane protein
MKIRVIKNYLIYGSGQLINLIAPLIVAPKVISVCGIENWGKIGVAISVFTLLGLFIDFGSNLLGVKEISSQKNDLNSVKNYLNIALIFKFFILLLMIFTAFLVFAFFDIKDKMLYALGLTMLSAQFFNVSWIYQGLEKFKTINKLIFLSKSSYLLLVFLFIKKREDFHYVLFFLGISNTLVYSYFFFKIYFSYKLRIFSVNYKLIKEYVLCEYPILLSNLSISIYVQSPILIIKFLLGDYYAGIYKIGDMILTIFRSYLSVFFNVSFPNFCRIYTINKSGGIIFLKKSNTINIGFLLSGILCIIILIKTTNIINISSDLMLFYLCFAPIPIIIAVNIPFYQFLIFKNHQKALSKILSFCSILMLFVCYFFTKRYQLNGSLIAVFLMETIISFLIILYYCLKYKVISNWFKKVNI